MTQTRIAKPKTEPDMPRRDLLCGRDFPHRPLERLLIDGDRWRVRCLRCGALGWLTRRKREAS